MSYKKELVDYMNKRLNHINKILCYPHIMVKENLEQEYKKLSRDDFYSLSSDDEIIQEIDLSGYIKVLMRWK